MATIEAAKFNKDVEAVEVDWQDRYNTVLATLDEECQAMQVYFNDLCYFEHKMSFELKDHLDIMNSKLQVIREMLFDAGKM